MFKEKAIRKIAVRKIFCAKIRIGLQYIIGIGCYAPAIVCCYPSFHRLQNTYRVLIQAQHGANKSPVSFGLFRFLACVFIQVSPKCRADRSSTF